MSVLPSVVNKLREPFGEEAVICIIVLSVKEMGIQQSSVWVYPTNSAMGIHLMGFNQLSARLMNFLFLFLLGIMSCRFSAQVITQRSFLCQTFRQSYRTEGASSSMECGRRHLKLLGIFLRAHLLWIIHFSFLQVYVTSPFPQGDKGCARFQY